MDTGEHTVALDQASSVEKDPTKFIISGVALQGNTPFSMPLITHLDGNLWHGGWEYGFDLGNSFDTVVSLYPWQRYPMKAELREYTMYDGHSVDEKTVIEAATFVNKRLDEGKRVLVHCQAGLNRSSLVVATALIQRGVRPVDAIRIIREKRSPACLCNPKFQMWLLTRATKAIEG